MKLGFDYYQNLETPVFVLCKPNGDRIGAINCTAKNGSFKFNDCDEVNFTTYLYTNEKKNPVYEKINNLMHLELPSIGRYVIANVTIHSEGTKHEYKECSAISEEVLTAQKYLELFTINMGTTESIDGVSFYNIADTDKSLLHLTLEKCPDWSIGHVDNDLVEMQRSFEITRQDVYSFLTKDVSEAFECIFEFDTVHHLINVYKDDTVGEDTNILISYANLMKNAQISSSTDNIKTCLTVTGSDDLSLREVNMGYDRIYNFDYFHDLEYMSKGLYDAFGKWNKLWDSKVSEYEKLVTQYQNYYNDIHKLESEKMPDDLDSTDWSSYGLNPLKEKLAVYEQKQAVMIKAGQAEPTHKDYKTMYESCYNAIQSIKKQIEFVEAEINTLKESQSAIYEQMSQIIELVEMKNNFTGEQLNELSKFIREEELSSDNYIVTDIMTESERLDMLHDMLKYGQKELAKVAVPTMEFSMDIINIYAVPEFKNRIDKFQVGNYIFVSLRDDYALKLRLLTMDINFYDKSDFSLTFGNVAKLKGSKLFEDVTNALELASSAATTVSFNSSYWNKANVDSTEIGKMLSDGLLSSGNRIATTESDVIIDKRGIIITNNPNQDYKDDVIFLGGGQIVFSDDGLKTVKTALGRVTYTKPNGTKVSDFGLLAQFIISGYVGGSTIEGNEIIGGTITGTSINNGNGTFSVDKDGKLKATSAAISGTITATEGYIGGTDGFTIKSGKIYSGGKSTLSAASDGVYIGTDGISLGKNNLLQLKNNGSIIAQSGTIGGAEIGADYIRATNGKWKLSNSTGIAEFTDVLIKNVRSGSAFGGISFDGTNTSASFGGGFSASYNFNLSGGALSAFNNLVANRINANYIKSKMLEVDYADIEMSDIKNITTKALSVTKPGGLNPLIVGQNGITQMYFNGHQVTLQTKTVDGSTISYLAWI